MIESVSSAAGNQQQNRDGGVWCWLGLPAAACNAMAASRGWLLAGMGTRCCKACSTQQQHMVL